MLLFHNRSKLWLRPKPFLSFHLATAAFITIHSRLVGDFLMDAVAASVQCNIRSLNQSMCPSMRQLDQKLCARAYQIPAFQFYGGEGLQSLECPVPGSMAAQVWRQNLLNTTRRRRREVDHRQENDLDHETGSGAGVERDTVTDIGIDRHPCPKTRKRPSDADRRERNDADVARKKEKMTVTILVLGRKLLMKEREMLMKIDQDQSRLQITSALTTGVAGTETSTENGRGIVTESTDLHINTARVTALIVMIGPEAEIVTEREIGIVNTVIAIVDVDPKSSMKKPKQIY
jgi:hypothetical protein